MGQSPKPPRLGFTARIQVTQPQSPLPSGTHKPFPSKETLHTLAQAVFLSPTGSTCVHPDPPPTVCLLLLCGLAPSAKPPSPHHSLLGRD